MVACFAVVVCGSEFVCVVFGCEVVCVEAVGAVVVGSWLVFACVVEVTLDAVSAFEVVHFLRNTFAVCLSLSYERDGLRAGGFVACACCVFAVVAYVG